LTVHPVLRRGMTALYGLAVREGLRPRVTSVVRSRSTQARLYRRYRAGLSRWPAAPPGQSLHEYGLAFDMVAGDLRWLGSVWESWGGRWGGRFGDDVHFELQGG